MPQASDELRQKMKDIYGDLSPTGPLTHLKNRGFIEHRGYLFNNGNVALTDFDWDCIDFLHQEWDYGYRKS